MLLSAGKSRAGFVCPDATGLVPRNACLNSLMKKGAF